MDVIGVSRIVTSSSAFVCGKDVGINVSLPFAIG